MKLSVEETIERATNLLGKEWIEFPVELTRPPIQCDSALVPKKIVFLKLPEGQERLEQLQEVWGYKGFPL
jgi:hypothetical protein